MMLFLVFYLGLVFYFVGIVVTSKTLAGHFAWAMLYHYKERYEYLSEKKTTPDGEMWLGAWASAIALGVIWPVTVAFAFAPYSKVGAEKRHELESREKKIEEQERWLDQELKAGLDKTATVAYAAEDLIKEHKKASRYGPKYTGGFFDRDIWQ